MLRSVLALATAALLASSALVAADSTLTRTTIAVLRGAQSGYESVSGVATLTQQNDDTTTVSIALTVSGLPVGTYGFHIHTFGDISTAFPMVNAITGGHFNPLNQPHGCYPNVTRHEGDIGSIVVTDASVATTATYVRDLIQLGGSTQSVVGRAMVIHQNYDDCSTGTGLTGTGNSGTRIAQGVIGIGQGVDNAAAVTSLTGSYTGLAVLAPTGVLTGMGFSSAVGVVQFSANDTGFLRVVGVVTGLPPLSNHSIHVHQFGDISSVNATAAGAHFNPYNNPHGLYPNVTRHEGDIGNVITADASGTATFDVVRDLLVLTDANGENIIGRAVILHQKVDVGVTGQPTGTGGAGQRFMQGVIGISSRAATSAPVVPSTKPAAAAQPSSISAAPSNAATQPMVLLGAVAAAAALLRAF